MKADCGLVTPSIFHRVKIKEESNECVYPHIAVSSSTNSVPTSTTGIFINSMSTCSNTPTVSASNSVVTAIAASSKRLAVSTSLTALISTAVCTSGITALNSYSNDSPKSTSLIVPNARTTSCSTYSEGPPLPHGYHSLLSSSADPLNITKTAKLEALPGDADHNVDSAPKPNLEPEPEPDSNPNPDPDPDPELEPEPEPEPELDLDLESDSVPNRKTETKNEAEEDQKLMSATAFMLDFEAKTDHQNLERGFKPNANGNLSTPISSLNEAEPQHWTTIEKGASTDRKERLNVHRKEQKGHSVELSASHEESREVVSHPLKAERADDIEAINGFLVDDQQSDILGNLTSASSNCAGSNDDGTTAANNPRITNNESITENINRTGSKCITSIFASHAKLKRLLGTLVQFASDISSDTGDAVRTLVLALLSASMTAEEFHSALQEATNFPLRGFVLQYLKHSLPTLQKDLTTAARAINQNCSQFLQSNENVVLEAIGLMSASEPTEIFGEYVGETGAANGNVAGSGNGSCNGNSSNGNAVGSGSNGESGVGNLGSLHYGLRPNTNPSIGGIQQTNNSSSASLRYYPNSPHPTKRRASETPHCESGSSAEDTSFYGKRHLSSWFQQHVQQAQSSSSEGSSGYCWYHPLHSSGGAIQAAHAQGQGLGRGKSQVHMYAPIHGLGHGQGQGHGQNQNHNQNQVQASGHGLGHAPGHGHGPNPMPPSLVQINQINTFSANQHLSQQQQQLAPIQAPASACGSLGDEWKNIHVMLNCILGMVEKTKRALAILQRRGCTSPVISAAITSLGTANNPVSNTTQTATNANAQQGSGTSANIAAPTEPSTNDREGNLKRLSGEIVAQTLRATEDRVAEVKRKAEEAVLEVKRAAVAEMQRAIAVAVAESRANDRFRTHRLLELPLAQRSQAGFGQGPLLRLHGSAAAATSTATALDPTIRSSATPTSSSSAIASTIADEEKDLNLQTIASSSCWNCSRQALETCGGCGIARYCGPFCQHRDWEAGHHATCNSWTIRQPRRSTSPSPPRAPSAGVILSNSLDDIETSGAPTTVPGTSTGTPIKGK